MTKSKVIVAFFLINILIIGINNAIIWAQEDQEALPEEKKPKTVNIKADKFKWDREADTQIYTGNPVELVQGDTTLYSDQLSVEKKEVAHAEGNIRLIQPNVVITGEALDYYFKEDRVVITGNVLLEREREVEPEEEGGTPTKKKMTVASDQMDINIETQDLSATGNVKFTEEDTTASGDKAIYSDKDEKLTLIDNAMVKQGDNEISAGEIIISLKEDWIEAEKGEAGEEVGITFIIEEEEEEKE